MAQRDKARDEAMSEMKAAGVEYDQRIEELEKITYPQPMRDAIYDHFDRWRTANPWIGDRNIAPKGVVRDLWDRAMDFPAFVRHYGLKRSEGVLLRYLSDVYKTMGRAVPEEAKTDEVDELAAWLGAVIRATDSSLLDEWTAMVNQHRAAGTEVVPAAEGLVAAAVSTEVPITADRGAFRALVRSRVFRWVQFAATGRWEAWSNDMTEIGDRGWTAPKLESLFAGYLDAYGSNDASRADDDRPAVPAIGIDGDARGPLRFIVHEADNRWEIEQLLADPDGHDEWYLAVTVDLEASATDGDVVAKLEGLRRR